MIRVTIRRGIHGRISGFSIRGHADFAPLGSDIVCAGVTAIAETAILGIRQVAGHPCRVRRGPGFLECRLHHSSVEEQERTQVILETMLVGLKDIENDYGDYVRITEGG